MCLHMACVTHFLLFLIGLSLVLDVATLFLAEWKNTKTNNKQTVL